MSFGSLVELMHFCGKRSERCFCFFFHHNSWICGAARRETWASIKMQPDICAHRLNEAFFSIVSIEKVALGTSEESNYLLCRYTSSQAVFTANLLPHKYCYTSCSSSTVPLFPPFLKPSTKQKSQESDILNEARANKATLQHN